MNVIKPSKLCALKSTEKSASNKARIRAHFSNYQHYLHLFSQIEKKVTFHTELITIKQKCGRRNSQSHWVIWNKGLRKLGLQFLTSQNCNLIDRYICFLKKSTYESHFTSQGLTCKRRLGCLTESNLWTHWAKPLAFISLCMRMNTVEKNTLRRGEIV